MRFSDVVAGATGLLIAITFASCKLDGQHLRGWGGGGTPGFPGDEGVSGETGVQTESLRQIKILRRDGQAPVIKDELSLAECLALALENNHQRPASRFAVEIAELQHKQALSGYWPQLHGNMIANLRSDDMNFLFPESEFHIPAMNVNTPAMAIGFPGTSLQTPPTSFTIPAHAFGPNFPPSNLQVPIGSQNVNIPGGEINVPAGQFHVPSSSLTIPEQDVKVMDRRTYGAVLDLKWLVLDGGMRRSLRKQAAAGVAAANESARRTDLEIIHDVRRMYNGAVLTSELEQLGLDTLARMEATLDLTEELYQGGSMTVKKTDYLRNKVIVESLRGMTEKLKKNRLLATSALAHSMGVSWRSEIRPNTDELPFSPFEGELEKLLADTYEYSPDWRRIEHGLEAASYKIKEERSAHAPKLAITGNAHAVENWYEGGFSTDSNLNAWNIGIGLEIPLFNGFLTRNRVKEAKARLAQMREQKELLRAGLALQVKALFLQIESLENQEVASATAEGAAVENRDLNERAYREDLVEASDVFESQLIEAMTKARRLKLRYDHIVSRSELDLVVGNEIIDQLGLLSGK